MNITGKNWGGKGGGLPRIGHKDPPKLDFPQRGASMDTMNGGPTMQSLGNYAKLTPAPSRIKTLDELSKPGIQPIPALTIPNGR